MKKVISIFAALLLLGATAFAQGTPQGRKNDDGRREKMRSEMVAFITTELELNEAEAQKFWPVYNEILQARREAMGKKFVAMRALREGVANGADCTKLIDDYVDATRKADAIEYEVPRKVQKVLPAQKAAKLILSEERFRRQQIGRLGGDKKH